MANQANQTRSRPRSNLGMGTLWAVAHIAQGVHFITLRAKLSGAV